MRNKSGILLLLFCQIFYTVIVKAQTPCEADLAGIYPCHQVDLMSHTPLASLGGGTSANDVWGWTDALTGKEYAIMGMRNGTSFVDISTPTSPIYLGILPTASSNSSWRDMKVNGDFVYVVSEAGNHGVQSFDLKTLRNVASPPATFSALDNLPIPGNGNAHNIVGLGEAGYMVVVGASTCSGGLTFVNVQDPANMIIDGCFSTDGYTHDAVCFIYHGPDSAYIGKQICIASNEDTQTFIDVTDKTNPISLARIPYNSRYTHQGWVTEDQKYLLFGDELDEVQNPVPTRTFMMDISDLDNPSDPVYYDAATAAIDHNQYVLGRYAYQANYRAGFRMIDLKNISSALLSEVAYFDIYPENDNANFNGAWSVFPYFKSGLVIVSGIEQGLFILMPKVPHVVMEANKFPVLASCTDQDIVFDINLTPYAGYTDLVNLSVQGVPAGATATFANNPVSPDGATTLTIHHPTGFMGAHSLTIEARGPMNDTLHDVTVAFIVNEVTYVDNSFLSIYGESGDYGAINLLESNAIIKVNNTILLNAGQEILLQMPFEVRQGAVLEASINACGSSAKTGNLNFLAPLANGKRQNNNKSK